MSCAHRVWVFLSTPNCPKSCRQHYGKTAPKGDPLWDKLTPPLHDGCGAVLHEVPCGKPEPCPWHNPQPCPPSPSPKA
jgi:hypothetical protein